MKALLLLLLLAAPLLRGDESAALARSLWSAAPEPRAPLLRPLLSLILLSEHNRLLPRDADTPLLESLASRHLAGQPQTEPAAFLPPADQRAFDGTAFAGGNFASIDALIGLHSQPVAFDRQLPVFLVPLKEDEVPILEKLRAAFQNRPDSEAIRKRTDRLLEAGVGASLVEDGCVLRPYAGKLDDLYFRLFQEGDAASQVNFYALLETLPERTYHPAAGVGAPAMVPPMGFSLSDILSGGGLVAFQQFTSENPDSKLRNPFAGIALHLLPLLDPAPLPPGSSISVTHDVMRRALESPKRFSAPEVKPIFRDPSRFLGQAAPVWLAVKNGPSISREEVESELALPQSLQDPAANEAFRGPVYWENPAHNPLLPSAPNQLVPATPPGRSAPRPPQRVSPPSAPPSAPPNPPAKSASSSQQRPLPPSNRPTQPGPPPRATPVQAVPSKPQPNPEQSPAPERNPGSGTAPTLRPPAPAELAPGIPVVRALPVDREAEGGPGVEREKKESRSQDPRDPTYRPKPRFSVAVLFPEAEQAEAYLRGIAENDSLLKTGFREENHAVCKARWLLEALGALEAMRPESARALEPSILTEVGGLRSKILRLREDRLQLLRSRQSLRESAENRLREDRLKRLRNQLGTPL